MLSEDEEELLDGVEEADGSPSERHPLLTGVIAVCLVLVMVSYIWLSPTVFSGLLGVFQSDVVINSSVSAGNTTIRFSDGVESDLSALYGDFPEEETALCMYGSVDNGTYTVTNYTVPRVISASFSHVRHESCPSSAIVVFHTHPERRCLPSSTDRLTLGEVQERNEKTIMLIMCESNRYTVVTDPEGAL